MSRQRPVYVADTHSLLWWLTRPHKLRVNGRAAFAAVSANEADLIVPMIVIAEIVFVVARRRLQLDVESVVGALQSVPNVRIVPLGLGSVLKLPHLADVPEMHDRLIVAEAIVQGAQLITNDEAITRAGVVATVW